MRELRRGVYHGGVINDAAYQCVNAAKRRQIAAAPGHFKRVHRADPFPSKIQPSTHARIARRRAKIVSSARSRVPPGEPIKARVYIRIRDTHTVLDR